MLEADRLGGIKNTLAVMQGDITSLLSEYAVAHDIGLTLCRTQSGYRLEISADLDEIYEVGKIAK